MDKISENITIDFEINSVVFTKINTGGKRIDVYSASNHAGFSLTLNDRPIYPLKNIVLVD